MIPIQSGNLGYKSIPNLVVRRRFGFEVATSAPEDGGTYLLVGDAPPAGATSEMLIPVGTTGIGAGTGVGEGGGPEGTTFPFPLASRFYF